MTDWSNKEEVLEAVREDGMKLENASEELRTDKEVVLEAVTECGWALKYASEVLRADLNIVLTAVDIGESGWRKWGDALKYASEELRADKDVVLWAIESYGPALEFASDALKADKEVVLAAVKEWGEQRCYEDPPEVNDLPIKFADLSLKTNREFLKKAIELIEGLSDSDYEESSVYDLVVTALETDFSNKEK